MQSIVNYCLSLFSYIFGDSATSLLILYPSTLLSRLSSIHSSAVANGSIVSYWFSAILGDPGIIFSSFLWVWFSWLCFHLLFIWPFNWFRSIIRKCKG